MEEKTLEELAVQLHEAKVAENKAKEIRIEAEEAIAKLIETDADGSKTVDAGEHMKITVKRGLLYKADVDDLRKLWEEQGITVPLKLVPESVKFDEKLYEEMRESVAPGFLQISKLVTVTPAKTSVTLKLK